MALKKVSYIKGGMQRRVFENRILRRIFGTKRDENGEWRRLNNEEIPSLYRSSKIFRVIKSRRLRWECHVARMEEGMVLESFNNSNMSQWIYFDDFPQK